MAETWFRERLKTLDRTQKQMALATGIEESALSRSIRGKRTLTAAEAVRIAAFLGVDVAEVVHHAERPSAAAKPDGSEAGRDTTVSPEAA